MAALLALVPFARSQGADAAIAAMSPGQRSYTEGCGGCHGLSGVSASSLVPPLKDSVGRFFCIREGRDYVVRLPNVAFANMSDDRLAQVLNFVVFGLGGDSVPSGPHASPYTSAEVHRLRANPLKATDLVEARRAVLAKSEQACRTNGAIPADTRNY